MLRTTTAHDLLMDIHAKDKDNMQVNAQKALLGAIVMTRLILQLLAMTFDVDHPHLSGTTT